MRDAARWTTAFLITVLLAGCDRFPRSTGSSAETAAAAAPGAGEDAAANPVRELLFDGFEGDTVARFWLPGNYGSGLYVPGAVVTSREYARTGKRSARIAVKEGDIKQPGGDGKDTERAELDSGYFPLLGHDVWYGFSFLIPPGFPIVDDRLVLSNCKQRDIGTPLIAQRFRNGRHELTVWEPGAGNGETRHYPLPAIQFGRWNDMVFHVRYSTAEDGRVEVWMNGSRVASYRGRTAVKGAEYQFYNKIGLYRDRWKEPMTAYFDNYTLGGSFEKVNPARFDGKPQH